jgi:peptidoglycan/LPS O-acetylase OafA/YrhL
MNSNTSSTVIQLLAFGLMLAMIKLFYSFFDFYNILDVVVFLAAGIILGGKVPSKRWVLVLLLALPAFTLCLLFVLRLGYSSIVNGVGTSFAVSLILIPVATSIGVFINAKRALRTRVEKK